MKDKFSLWGLNKISLEAKWLLPFTSLLTPYLIFLSANNYALNARAPWIIGAGLVLVAFLVAMLCMIGGSFLGNLLTAALITLFLDIQLGWINGGLDFCLFLLGILFIAWVLKDNFYIILNTLFTVFLAVTLIQILVQNPDSHGENELQSMSLDERYPLRVIHLMLDEHIGIEGVPLETEAGRAIKKRMQEFYNRYGFYVFGDSYSRYSHTLDSIPNMLNYSDSSMAKSLVKKDAGSGSWVLLENKYFDDLGLHGYRINVWESKFLLYCSDNKQKFGACNTYKQWDTKVMQDFDLFIADQVKILFVSYLKHSMIYGVIKRHYNNLKTIAIQYGVLLPDWSWDRLPTASALNSLKILDVVWEDILSLPTGNFLFAHLIFPHSPFIANPDCTVRKNVDSWLVTEGLDKVAERKEKYRLYFDQVACLYTRLEYLFDKMQEQNIWKDSLIIVQGDHGSRISLTNPEISKDELTDNDLIDLYSTLFAVKLPGMDAAYSSERIPIDKLLEAIVLNYGSLDELFSVTPSTPYVYLPAEEPDNRLTIIPYTATQ